MVHITELEPEKVAELLDAYGSDHALQGERDALHDQIVALPAQNLGEALRYVRYLGTNERASARWSAGLAMGNLAIAYAAQHAHINGLINLWVDLMSDPDGGGETATGVFEGVITEQTLHPRFIATIASVMAGRLQGDQGPDEWADAP